MQNPDQPDSHHLDLASETDIDSAKKQAECYISKLQEFDQLGDEAIQIIKELRPIGKFLKSKGCDRLEINLKRVKSISLEAARELGEIVYALIQLNGLTDLTPELAAALAKPWSMLEFGQLKQMSAEVVRALSNTFCLRLLGIKNLDREFLLNIAGIQGILELDHAKTIDDDAIEPLRNLPCAETYIGLEEIDEKLATGLRNIRRTIILTNPKKITMAAAEILAHNKGILIDNDILDSYFDSYESNDKIKRVKVESPGLPTLPAEALGQIQPWIPFFEKNPNFKKTVLDSSADLASYLRQKGIDHPKVFQNLNAKTDLRPILEEAFALFGESTMVEFKDSFRSKTLTEFSEQTEFIETHKDEVIQTLADQLLRIQSDLAKNLKKKSKGITADRKTFMEEKINDPALPERVKNRFRKQLSELLGQDTRAETSNTEDQLQKISNLQEKISKFHFLKPREWGCKLASRNTSELTLGDECSDCTSANISGMNFWTVPVWLTDPGFNFVLQYDENGDLAHKFGVVWEETKEGEPILTIDSMELGNSQKGKAGMNEAPKDEEKEQKMVDSAIAFIRDWAKSMGLRPENIYAAQYSNTGTSEFESFPVERLNVAKIGQLEASEKTLKSTNPDAPGKLKVYLQSLRNPQGELQEAQNEENAEKNIELGDAQKDFGLVEKAIQGFILDGSADKADCETAKAILKLAKENPKEAARKMNIFLVMQAKADTKAKLSIEGKRIDIFLNSRGHSIEKYLSAILGQVLISKGLYQKALLRHLVKKKKK